MPLYWVLENYGLLMFNIFGALGGVQVKNWLVWSSASRGRTGLVFFFLVFHEYYKDEDVTRFDSFLVPFLLLVT